MTADKLNQAIALIKAGNKPAALPILKEYLQANPQDENAWLWLYACVDEAEKKKFCLQKALEINPGNQQAQLALQRLAGSTAQADRPSASSGATPGAVRSTSGSGGNPKRPAWLFAVGVCGLLLCLCIGTAVVLAQTGQWSALAAGLPLFSTATLTPSLTPTATATFTASPTSTVTETATPTPAPSSTPAPTTATSSSGIAPLEALESYRLTGKSSSKTGFGGSSTMAMTASYTKEWDKASQAHRTIEVMSFYATEKQAPITMESISIGKTTWSKTNDSWMRIDSQQVAVQQNDIDWQSLKFVGDEKVNGIPCKHYTVDEDIMKLSGSDNRLEMTTHAKGDLWVANRADMPAVILREKLQTQMSGSFFSFGMGIKTATPDPLMEATTQEPQGMVSYDEYEVTDVNTVIDIQPPQATAVP